MAFMQSKVATLLGFTGLLALTATGCLSQKDVAPSAPGERKSQLKAPSLIEVLKITADRSCQAPEECKVLEFGSRPCGGSSQMLVYSTVQVNGAELQDAADDFTQEESKYNQSTNAVGTCEALLPPQSTCAQNLCVQLDSQGQSTAAETLIVNFQNDNVASDALSELQDYLPVASSKKIFASPPMYSIKLRAGIRAEHYIPLIKELVGVISVEKEKTIPTPQQQ